MSLRPRLAAGDALLISREHVFDSGAGAFGFKLAVGLSDATIAQRSPRTPQALAHLIDCRGWICAGEWCLDGGQVLAHRGQVSLSSEVFAEKAALLAQGACSFGSRIGFAELLHDQVALCAERDKLASGSRRRLLIASFSRNAFSFSHARRAAR